MAGDLDLVGQSFSLLSFVQTAFFEAIERLPCFGHAVWQSSKQKNSNGENCFLINNASRSQQTHGDFGCLCDLCDAKIVKVQFSTLNVPWQFQLEEGLCPSKKH